MAYTKTQIYRITSRLYSEFKSNPDIVLKKIKVFHGEYYTDLDKITIDYRKEILPTIIHEFLHKWNPKKSETWVIQQERQIVNALSIRQAKNILKRFALLIC